MLPKEENDLLTQTGPGTPMGDLFRRFWLPVMLSEELAGPSGPPVAAELEATTARRRDRRCSRICDQ